MEDCPCSQYTLPVVGNNLYRKIKKQKVEGRLQVGEQEDIESVEGEDKMKRRWR
jgi:hypothetical protein